MQKMTVRVRPWHYMLLAIVFLFALPNLSYAQPKSKQGPVNQAENIQGTSNVKMKCQSLGGILQNASKGEQCYLYVKDDVAIYAKGSKEKSPYPSTEKTCKEFDGLWKDVKCHLPIGFIVVKATPRSAGKQEKEKTEEELCIERGGKWEVRGERTFCWETLKAEVHVLPKLPERRARP